MVEFFGKGPFGLNCMSQLSVSQPVVDPSLFGVNSGVTFLNHGSFGSCPIAVLDHQFELQKRLESQPVQFLQRDLEPLLDDARAALAAFVGVADSDDLVFVENATSGVNTVLRSLDINPGDEIIVTDHGYNACTNAARFVAERSGARVVIVEIPFPINSPAEVISRVMGAVTERTRLLVIDHITSPTSLILPIADIIKVLNEQGIDTLVDGAHAPGMISLNLQSLGAAYYTGNCHKWICAPKSAGFLYVQKEKQSEVRPLTISHGANSPRTDRSRFQLEFSWMGTRDPTPALTVSFAIDYLDGLVPGGWSAIMKRNRQLALTARTMFCDSFNWSVPAPENMLGSMATLVLPESRHAEPLRNTKYLELWQYELARRTGIEVPIFNWPEHPKRILRFSAHVYNYMAQFDFLAEGIKELGDDQV